MKLKTISSFKNIQKGFTLVELLVVIAVLGVLASGLLIVIDPADKIASGNDARAINDIQGVASATENYIAGKADGSFPSGATFAAACGVLVTNGDLKGCPKEPTAAYTYSFSVTAANAGTISTNLVSKKYTAKPIFKYDLSTGKSCAVNALATACP
ncbi:MAG TPA: type II secretion system protein [Candidatus Saccharimonadales bacterium]|nr:type II secretion system protein [Candidatus Saccharimonadales bacterium]